MSIDENNGFVMLIMNRLKHYNHKKYWKMRKEVVDPNSTVPKLIRLYYLYRIKKMDAFNLSSMGTGFGWGAEFKTPPELPHLLNGIIISYHAKIGSTCIIHQQVTIAEKNGKSAIIGDNVLIGAGVRILGGVNIGNNVKIGANAVVVKDVPDNCTVVGIPARIISKNSINAVDDLFAVRKGWGGSM